VLGTDNTGKDVLTLIFRGGQDVLIVALLAGALTTVIAVGLGALAAYLGGVIDRAANGAANLLLTLPTFVLLSVLSTVVRLDNSLLLALLIALLSWPSLMRTVRSQVLTLRERDYVEAAVALDLGTPHIIVQEILPNMASYILINAIFVTTSAVYQMIALIFLGFVPISVKTPNWGVIINTASTDGAITNPDTTWWILAPVLTIAFLQWFLITLARSIEDVFNPRLK
jgi:peptide/nickel transport system permease protein